MEEEYFKIPVSKVMELLLNEERMKIRQYLIDSHGQTGSDIMDAYTPTPSEIVKLFIP